MSQDGATLASLFKKTGGLTSCSKVSLDTQRFKQPVAVKSIFHNFLILQVLPALAAQLFQQKHFILFRLSAWQSQSRDLRIRAMPHLTISQVAQQAGFQPSAIRYYERIGLLPRAERTSGQRRYDNTVLYRLALIQRARQLGFTLTEIRELFFGFREVASASARGRKLSRKKLVELHELMVSIQTMRRLLKSLARNCRCRTLEQCGQAMFRPAHREPSSKRASRTGPYF
jgi:MerR family redox-sensitive transcriptional activator SoxR